VIGREGDAAVQVALGGVAGDDDRAVLPALGELLGRVEAELALLLVGAVAGVARLLEDRFDLLGEVDLVLRRRRQRRCEEETGQEVRELLGHLWFLRN
jgi:hypothetical protein